MSKIQKLIDFFKNNPSDIRFEDAYHTASILGFDRKGEKGSHVVYARTDTQDILNFQNRNGEISCSYCRMCLHDEGCAAI